MTRRKIKKEFGKHYLVEYIGCDARKLNYIKDIKKPFLKAVKESKATFLKSYFYQFKPVGVSVMVFIAESHFSLHTWPQDQYVGLDILTCGRMYPQKAIESLRKYFHAKKIFVQIISRGF